MMLKFAYPREIVQQLRRHPIIVSTTGVFAIFVFIVTLVSMWSSESRRARLETAASQIQASTEQMTLSDNGRPDAPRVPAGGLGLETKDAATAQPRETFTVVAPHRSQAANTASAASVGLPNMRDVVSQKNSGDYTVQVGSFRNGQAARGLLQRLQTRGYPVFLRVVRMPDKGTTHRVRVGSFENRDEARRFGEVLRQKEAFIENVFVTVRN